MPCYHPLPAWYSKTVNESGKRGITFSLSEGFADKPLALPCGTCIGCRLERARQWAVRCEHESKLYVDNCFITCTYDDEHLPKNGSLDPRHWVLFMKRLRKHFEPIKIRFFHCGEYGDVTARPHHHSILFNLDFPDRVYLKIGQGGSRLYKSELLNKLWGYGQCTIGDCTFESAGYIARYSMKKLHGQFVINSYHGLYPEYLTMSRKPGIGYEFFVKHSDVWYEQDFLVVNGVKCRPPRYYDNLCEKFSPTLLEGIKRKRRREAADDPDSTGSRLIVREAVKEGAVQSLTREV